MYITLSQAKAHLNIDTDFTLDDAYITSLIEVAESCVENHIDIALSELSVSGKLPAPLIHSILLQVGNLYNNRESVTFSKYSTLPLAYEYLLAPYINY